MKQAIIFFMVLAVLGCTENVKIEKQSQIDYKGKTAQVYTSEEVSGLKLSPQNSVQFTNSVQPLETEIAVFVNPAKEFQKFIGIGGAITDASAEVFAKLPIEVQNELINAYYSKEKGIGYSLMRTSIHSCDFSSGSFTYIDSGDSELKSFSIEHDRKFRIPMIKRAIETAGGQLLTYASPWSPPAFMKSNKEMLHGGKLLPEYFESWALYYTKFIKEYENEGIPIWGITLQNEPMAVQRWESCIYTAEEERDFLKNHLGPIMQREGLGNKKIVVWDHNRDLMTHRANVIFEDPEASKYAWGMGFHWYEKWVGGSTLFENVGQVNQAYPDKKLLFTEGCVESFDKDDIQLWAHGERYARSIINDFNNGTVGWTDWNILLDEMGGPNHVNNFCFSPIHADTQSGKLIFTPSYYYIGHFSKFIRPGAKRISTTSNRAELMAASFRNTDGKIVTVAMNQGDEAINFKLIVGESASNIEMPAHSIKTFIY